MTEFTPAQIARLDQTMARLDAVLDELAATARPERTAHGREHATASLARTLLRKPPGNLASIAAAAVLRLVDQEDLAAAACPCTPEAPAHKHLTGGYRPVWDAVDDRPEARP